MPSLWKTIWKVLKKLKIELPCVQAILFLGMYPKEIKTLTQKCICTPVLTAALFMYVYYIYMDKHSYIYIYIYTHTHIHSAKAEAPVLWPPDAKSQLIRKDPDAGKD